MHIARTGLDAQDMRMRVISNNLANVNTTGFKRDRAAFETLAYQVVTAPGAASTAQTQIRHRAQSRHRRQGPGHCPDRHPGLAPDHRQFDRPGAGRRRFLPGADAGRHARLYPRGQFLALAEGLMITSEGYQVMPGITVPEGATSITIGTDGTVSATLQGQTEASQLGQIQVATFPNSAGLQSKGDNYLIETSASGAANIGNPGELGRGNIRQGMLEGSNVNVVEELVDMIETQRAYEVNSKMISATDEMLKYVNQNL
jgi:flagellar basal-body rod protein FlgG